MNFPSYRYPRLEVCDHFYVEVRESRYILMTTPDRTNPSSAVKKCSHAESQGEARRAPDNKLRLVRVSKIFRIRA